VTYNAYITAAGNCNQFEEARRAYNECVKLRLATVVTYNAYITAAGKCSQFSAGWDIAISQEQIYRREGNVRDADSIIATFIDLLISESEKVSPDMEHHLIGTANFWYTKKFNGRLETLGHKKLEQGKVVYDYHWLSKGEARLMTEHIFTQSASATIIIGRGLHSTSGHPIKKIVIQYCQDNNIRFEIDPRNTGRLHCVRVEKRRADAIPHYGCDVADISPPSSPPEPQSFPPSRRARTASCLASCSCECHQKMAVACGCSRPGQALGEVTH
jgi:hypothetical protein